MINQEFDLATTETAIVMLDRWCDGRYAVQLDSGTSVLVEGTLDRINRGETPTWDTLNDIGGTALATLNPGLVQVQPGPLEAIRITATGACVGRVMQTGAPA